MLLQSANMSLCPILLAQNKIKLHSYGYHKTLTGCVKIIWKLLISSVYKHYYFQFLYNQVPFSELLQVELHAPPPKKNPFME